MRVEILRGFCLGNGLDVAPGDIVDIPDARFALLQQQGRARPAKAAPESSPADSAADASLPAPPVKKGRKNA
jgi:hypothetical protein